MPSRKKKRTPRRTRSSLQPVSGSAAFRNLLDPGHLCSQAATLLLIGSRLRGDAPAAQARANLLSESAVPSNQATVEPVEDVAALGFPKIKVTADRFHPSELQEVARVRFTAAMGAQSTPQERRTASANLPRVAEAFYRDANSQTAAALLEVSLRHPNELVRVAAASSYFAVATEPEKALRVLEHGVRSPDRLTQAVAANSLAHVDPTNPVLAKLLRAKPMLSRRKPSRTSLIIHGTWARSSPWWQPPNGDFWTYLHTNVDGSLYGASDRFEWSGGYSDAARALAGSDLQTWVQQHNLNGLDLFTHSHGGSVAMLANHGGIGVGRMVLLSCPVHWPQYTPDFTQVNRVVSVRVHLDLVILADRGGQKFTDSRIKENVLPIWFDHFATHDPANWLKYNVPAMI